MTTGRVARRGAHGNMRTTVTSGKYKGKYRESARLARDREGHRERCFSRFLRDPHLLGAGC